MDDFTQDDLAAAFAEHRQRLGALAEKRLNPVLLKRMGVEDVLSEAYVNATKRLDYFAARDDVPVYYKLRTHILVLAVLMMINVVVTLMTYISNVVLS